MTKYFLNPFAVSGDKETVPDTAGASTLVNYLEGYTPEYELDPDTDPNGNYVGRQRMNQIFNDITTNLKFWQENSFPPFVADDGTGNPVSYPIGAIVRYTDGNYYQSVIDGTTATDPSTSTDFQQWPDSSGGARLNDLALDLNYSNATIGSILITSAAGNLLDEAEYILDLSTGLVWRIPLGIPSGAQVNALSEAGLLTTTNGSFQLKLKQADITQNVENLIKGNQNWNVNGVDGSLTSSPQAFVAGNEFTFGWKVASGSSLSDIVRIGGETTAPSGGIVEYIYTQDEAAQVNENDTLFSVTNKLGLQTYAAGLATNGLKIDSTSVAGEVKLSIDFSVYTDGIAHLTLSNKRGQAQPINDEESEQATLRVKGLDFNKFVHVQDQRASSVGGGTSIAGIQQRELNTEVTNTLGATLASNKLTLEAGRYYCEARAPTNRTNENQIVVAKSDNTILVKGSSETSNSSVTRNTYSTAKGEFVLDSTTDVIIRHYTRSIFSVTGLGWPAASGFGEVYTDFLVWKISDD